MPTTFQQQWTFRGDVVAPQVLTRTNIIRAASYLDLTNYDGAFLTGRIGRSDAVAIACTAGLAGVTFFFYSKPNGVINHPDGSSERLSSTVAAVVGRINNGPGYAAELSPPTFVVDGTSLVPAAGVENLLFFWGTATDPTTLGNATALSTCEWNKWAKGTATSLTVRQPTQFARIDDEYITNQADVFSRIWLPGRCKYDVGFGYGDDTGGSNVAVHAFYETLDYVKKVTV